MRQIISILRNLELFSSDSRVVLFSLSLCLSLSPSVVAGQRVLSAGQAGHAFLKVPVSARAVALGEAFVGATGDATSMEYNPAGIAVMPVAHVALSRVMSFQDSRFSAVDAAWSWKKKTGVGFYYRQFSADDHARDISGNPAGDIAHRDAVGGIVLARWFQSRWGLGVGVKNVSRRIDQSVIHSGLYGARVKTSVWAVDAGLSVSLPIRAVLGISVQNMGPRSQFEYEGTLDQSPFSNSLKGEKEPLPLTLRVGAVHRVGSVAFSWEAMQSRDYRPAASAGVEIPLANYFVFRGGARHQRYFDVSVGMGIRQRFVDVDYAFSPRVDLGNVHRMTVGFRY